MAQSPGTRSPGRLTAPVVIGPPAGAGALLAVAGFTCVLGVLLEVPVFGSIQLRVRELVLGRPASR